MLSRFATPLLVLALIATGAAQTSDELREKFGKPNTEVFLIEPEIALTVVYAADGQACEMLIDTPHPLGKIEMGPSPLMPSGRISYLLEVLVPSSTRGEQISESTTQSGCNAYALTEYTHVTISRSQHNCQPDAPNRDMSVFITFKDRVCVER